ncbi:MAG TPA: ATP-binding cassette domain-containing protein [Polyangiaceae bacterium]|nr:MAG: putative ABC transporter ATP-binding protein [Deltaproteobacteria bacterium ADurb.Bin207]HNS99258.1 ATP-binding cassette domain-containing protein [Polyangiaceae bacterium]HNZ20882.1 ATP-binding cassette domain-containing protein [Polyangiaceae bacterium]HOD21455.1 ATP-binding cassette domain-containing protein [Polyangiaceae bacterium]HOE47563.1 ATP-binding cassette domain-containing protein [Polyangiaceae bacterium]
MIAIQGLQKAFREPVLRGIDLTVPKGCLYGLIGPGAAGKSVLLKHVVGLMRPDKGKIFVDGHDLLQMSELELQGFRKRFGIAFQNNALFDHLSVGENIAFPLRRLHKDMTEQEIQDRVDERLRAVALPGMQDRSPPSLSGGQKRRVGVARATVARPPILIYDEPAAGLDPVSSQKIFDLLKKEKGDATVIMVSSDLDRLLTVTDRVGMMLDGKIIFDGTTEQAQNSNNEYVRQFVHGLTEGPL